VSSVGAFDPMLDEFSCFGAGGVMTRLRILTTIIYVAQAAGIALGLAYAMWLMYPA
jgi:hypothetical protein